MKRRLVIFLILSVFILIFSKPAFAQFGNETITITTYYPSPHGVYGILRLYPRSAQPEEDNSFEGDLYYDDGTTDPVNRPEGVYVYNGSNWTKTSIGGGGGGGGGIAYSGEPYLVKLATPLQEAVPGSPLQMPGGSATNNTLGPEQCGLRSCSARGSLTEIERYSFNIDRSGIQANIRATINFPSREGCGCGSCACCYSRMIFDGRVVKDGSAGEFGGGQRYDYSYSYTTPVLSMGQHTVIFEFVPS